MFKLIQIIIIAVLIQETTASDLKIALAFHGLGEMFNTSEQYREFIEFDPDNKKYVDILSSEFGFDVHELMLKKNSEKQNESQFKLENTISQTLIYLSLKKACPDILDHISFVTAHSYGENIIPLVEDLFSFKAYAKFIHEIIKIENEWEKQVYKNCWLDVIRNVPQETVEQEVNQYLLENPENYVTIAGSLRKDYTSIVGYKEAVKYLTKKLNKPGYNPEKPYMRNIYMHSEIMRPIIKTRKAILESLIEKRRLAIPVINDHDGNISKTIDEFLIETTENCYLTGKSGMSKQVLIKEDVNIVIIIGEREEHSFIEEIGGKSKNIRFIKLNTPQAIYSIIDLLSHNSDYS